MLISLNWLRDFVDIPADVDPRQLAERLTLTTAEVEEVVQIRVGDMTASEAKATLDDWVIEIDNKSITHRPDLWGHYGIAREVAAMLDLPLKPLPVVNTDELTDDSLPEIPIEIDDPQACPRYSGIMFEGFHNEPAPALIQGRLANVGIRPINALVDLTNYIMAEIGQPMHAFDGDKVDRIEVGFAKAGSKFFTLDEVERTLPAEALTIQSGRKPVALAGIMGGLESEVTGMTKKLLLESANFNAATIRRCAGALGHRTEASTRFEKTLDPENTILGICRFIHLARQQFPEMKLLTRLSDCYPDPAEPLSIEIDPSYVSDFIGEKIPFSRMKSILESLAFKVSDRDDRVVVQVPSFRATKDIEGEADIIEEVARVIGYDNLTPVLPQATVRYLQPNRLRLIERRTLSLFCQAEGFFEIHDHIWYARDWHRQLDYEPGESITLKNPAADGMERLRKSLIPGLLHAAELNRRDKPDLNLINIGMVFPHAKDSDDPTALQQKNAGLLMMQRGKKQESLLVDRMKASLGKWALELFDRELAYRPATASQVPWEDSQQTVELMVGDMVCGRLSTVPIDLRRRVNEHFTAWSVVAAEINLTCAANIQSPVRQLMPVPSFPEVELDFSVLMDVAGRYETIKPKLSGFKHPLLRSLTFEGAYQGKGLPDGKRSLLLRTRLGHDEHTLVEEDIQSFRQSFESFLQQLGLTIRSS